MLKKQEYMFPAICLFCIMGTCSYLFYRNFFLLLLFFPICIKGKTLLERRYKEKREKQLLVEFRDFLFSLSATFATGRHMKEGMENGAVYLREIYGEKSFLALELEYMLNVMDTTSVSDTEVLVYFAEETDLEDIHTFVDVYRACVESGGNLVNAVDKAAEVIGEKIKLENEIKTLISQKKFEGRIIALMPFLMLLFLHMIAPSYLDVMYESMKGRVLMTMALLLNVLTVFWIERMTSVEL